MPAPLPAAPCCLSATGRLRASCARSGAPALLRVFLGMTLTGLAELPARLPATPVFLGVQPTAAGCAISGNCCRDVDTDSSDPGLPLWRCMSATGAPANQKAPGEVKQYADRGPATLVEASSAGNAWGMSELP